MRTTLDIDDDVLLAARERAARDHTSIGAVISALARDALRRPAQPSSDALPRRGGGRFALLPARDEVVTLEHVRALREAEGV